MRIFLGHYTSSVGDEHALKAQFKVIGTKREPKERKQMYRGRAVKHRESKTTAFFISRLGKGSKGVIDHLLYKWSEQTFVTLGFYFFLITL